MDTHEIAWAAGFFDGEGCTYFTGTKDRTLRITIVQRTENRFVLERFKKAIGGYGNIRNYESRSGRKPQSSYYCSKFGKVVKIINILRPYLSPEKIKQADIATEKYVLFKPSFAINGTHKENDVEFLDEDYEHFQELLE